jgi:hypothetical protein
MPYKVLPVQKKIGIREFTLAVLVNEELVTPTIKPFDHFHNRFHKQRWPHKLPLADKGG